jgi:hypothetical protein
MGEAVYASLERLFQVELTDQFATEDFTHRFTILYAFVSHRSATDNFCDDGVAFVILKLIRGNDNDRLLHLTKEKTWNMWAATADRNSNPQKTVEN